MGAIHLRCLLTDHSQWGCGNAVEWNTPLPHPRLEPGCAVHDLWGHEEEGRERREEGERAQEMQCGFDFYAFKEMQFVCLPCWSGWLYLYDLIHAHVTLHVWTKLKTRASLWTNEMRWTYWIFVFFDVCFQSQISSAEIFVIGAIAKAIATTATYPLQTVQAILRVNTDIYPLSFTKAIVQRHTH